MDRHSASCSCCCKRRTQRRLRQLLLCGPAQPAAGQAARGAGHTSLPATAIGTERRAARPGRGERQCLALRTLSGALCDEADAARVRRQVRCCARCHDSGQRASALAGGRGSAFVITPSRPAHARLFAQALEHSAPALLWRCALDGMHMAAPAAAGGGARDRLAHAVATVLGDLFAYRADDAVFVAVQHVLLGGKFVAWHGATVHASRPLRVAAAAQYCLFRCLFSAGACLGVRPPPRPPPVLVAARGHAPNGHTDT